MYQHVNVHSAIYEQLEKAIVLVLILQVSALWALFHFSHIFKEGAAQNRWRYEMKTKKSINLIIQKNFQDN